MLQLIHMYISKIVIENYKSFLLSDEIKFGPGINIVIGPNNTGKTALLEAIRFEVPRKPHRSVFGSRLETQETTTFSKVDITIQIDAGELQLDLNKTFWLPNSAGKSPNNIKDNFLDSLSRGIQVTLPVSPSMSFIELDYGIYQQQGDFLRFTPEGVVQDQNIPIEKLPAFEPIRSLITNIYRFDAERLKVSACAIGVNPTLNPNASNLPEVLQLLNQDNPSKFKRYVNLVNRIFPSVKWVSVFNETPQQVLIKIWRVEADTERDDLAIPLNECGTGIGQALAILYVIINSNLPRIILIDEPQSFLHPGAARTLIEILKEFPQHQYIITTHSPEILATANPSTITSLRLENGETKSKSLMLDQTAELREVFDDVGVRFGDLFFADDILWVEGPTEQKTFPLIISQMIPEAKNSRFTILSLINTGDLTSKKQGKKNAKLIFEIYNKLSGAHALAPPMVGIILDREELNDGEMKELNTLGNRKVAFISRSMFENYLLDSEAIAHVANQQEGFTEKPLSSVEIKEWLERNVSTGKYSNSKTLKKTQTAFNDTKTIKTLHGANLLTDLFKHFSEKRVEFRKTTHSVELTKWILENKPAQLKEIANTLRKILIEKDFDNDETLA